MRFKRIDVDTVRCIISEDELNENGLDLEDFLKKDGKTEDFLRKIITKAQEEVGYKVQGGNISIQVAVLPEHTLALTFSERADGGIANLLENLKDAVENLVKSAPGQSACQRNSTVNGQNGHRLKDKPDGDFILKGKNVYELCFLSLDDAISYAKGIVEEQDDIKSSLYYLDRERAYYLIFEKGTLDDKQVCRLLSAALEFTEGLYAHTATRAFIAEHGKCIIEEKAVKHLQEI